MHIHTAITAYNAEDWKNPKSGFFCNKTTDETAENTNTRKRLQN